MGLLKGNAQKCVYVVDENYRIISYNDVFQKTFPNIQYDDICYQHIVKEKEPCKDCPIQKDEYENGVLFYDTLGCWVERRSGAIDWPGKGKCSIIFLWEICEREKYPKRLSAAVHMLEEKNKEIVRQNTELQAMGQRMESILRLAKICSWEWDIRNYTLRIDDGNDGQKTIRDFPACVEELSIIERKCKDDYFAYLEDMKSRRSPVGTRFDIPIIGREGHVTWYQIACEILRDDVDNPLKAVGYYVDITEQKSEYLKSREDVKALEVDELTGLYNRQTAIPKMRNYLQTMGREETAAILMFDMDNFKLANDVFGHIYGDSVIAQNAQKLRKFFRDGDVMCRIGGDEFLVLCKNIREEDIEKKIKKIIEETVTTCIKGEQQILFSMSAGYALAPEMGNHFDELYEKSDIALFSAKMDGKGGYRKYDCGMKSVRYELAKEKEEKEKEEKEEEEKEEYIEEEKEI